MEKYNLIIREISGSGDPAVRLSAPSHKYSDVFRALRRPICKAREGSNPWWVVTDEQRSRSGCIGGRPRCAIALAKAECHRIYVTEHLALWERFLTSIRGRAIGVTNPSHRAEIGERQVKNKS